MRNFLFLFILLTSFSLLAQNKLVIENVTIISPHYDSPKLHMNVEIDNGRIKKITRKKIPSNGLKIDGSGKFLTPGIMDSHAHVSSIPGMGFAVEPMSAKHPLLTELYFKQVPKSFLYYGVTQILDPNPGLSWQNFVSQKERPDYFRCEVITSKNTFPYVEKTDDKSRSMYTYLIDEKAKKNELYSAEYIVNEISKSGASCIKIYFENGYGESSKWEMLLPDTLQRISLAAKKKNLPIVAHANALDMQQLALNAGIDVIAHGLWNWGKYRNSLSITDPISKVLDAIVERNIGFMPTQRVILGLGEQMIHNISDSTEFVKITPKELLDWYKTPEAQWFREELRNGFDGMSDEMITNAFIYGRAGKARKIINYLNERKHPILLGSDFPGSPSYANQPGLTTFLEMKELANSGLTLREVLNAATINNAKQFNLQIDYGTVQVGKIANLLLLEENPLNSIEAWDSISTIILKGKPILRKELAVKNNQQAIQMDLKQ